MIRRDVLLSDGRPGWVLISQVEHARLSGKLAEAFGVASQDAPTAGECLQAIFHHDDGWAEWEKSPTLDLMEGRPRSFLEMPHADSLPIWTQSIEIVRQFGPLAGHMVADHFATLLRSGDSHDDLPAKDWLAWNDELRDTLIEEVRQKCDTAWGGAFRDREEELAQDALGYLQVFDRLSLWFCMTPCRESFVNEGLSETFTLADKTNSAGATSAGALDAERVSHEPIHVLVAPAWPFLSPELLLAVQGTEVAAEHYASQEAFDRAPRRRVTIRWRITPS